MRGSLTRCRCWVSLQSGNARLWDVELNTPPLLQGEEVKERSTWSGTC